MNMMSPVKDPTSLIESPRVSPYKQRYSQVLTEQVRDEVTRLRFEYKSLQKEVVKLRDRLAREKSISLQKTHRQAEFALRRRLSLDFSTANTEHENYYRLAGRTLFKLREGYVGVRFETFFMGRYYEPYYIVFCLDSSSGRLIPYKHTIPIFVPFKHLVSAYLDNNIQNLFISIDDHLQNFVARRETFKQLSCSNLVIRCSISQAVDYACIEWKLDSRDHTEYREGELTFTGYIIFENLNNPLPSKVTVVTEHELLKEDARRWEQRILKSPLHVVFANLIAPTTDQS